ncbi:hypothetical protein [Pseudoalteromonas simplex]|jgi:hypothetical protein|uniref:hypothetical protein n=1 Tax=Pseudoalteromonas simplex TaxID=2783613 RepID=UPI001E5B41FF|nr:hypothetical protein [Pseudoalteromonas sp. A520]|tara:strand:+ start:125 stop:577 length:453 start_codon:yes stop_codon:yes gene_type:complete
MIYTRNNLPSSYQPYDKLTICSNSLIGGGHLVELAGALPLIIGYGEKPQVWLQAVSNPEKMEFVSVVENSVSKFPAVEVKEIDGSIIITIQGKQVLKVRNVSKSEAVVENMDLRPIGLNLYGDANNMNMPNGSFSGNSMSGGGILLGLGG